MDAFTKASVARSAVLSPVVCVAAFVPEGKVGVPLRLDAVPEVFAALAGISPDKSVGNCA
jgi:hypothetical protein